MVLCTKQRALWLFDEDKSLTPPADFKLGTLCEYFGVRLREDSDAHDAFYDVRATVELYRAMLGAWFTERSSRLLKLFRNRGHDAIKLSFLIRSWYF